MNIIEKVNLIQYWLVKLSYIKEKRKEKEIDDIDAYNQIKEILELNKEKLIELELYDVFEYAKEYYLLRIQ